MSYSDQSHNLKFFVLFVCKANRFRSPIAAQYFAHLTNLHQDNLVLQVSSAGTWAKSGLPIMPEALFLDEIFQLRLCDHRSRIIDKNLLSHSDLILTMTSDQKEALSFEFPSCAGRIFLLAKTVGLIPYDIPDLYAIGTTPKEIAFEIINIIDKGYDQIVNLGNSLREKKHSSKI